MLAFSAQPALRRHRSGPVSYTHLDVYKRQPPVVAEIPVAIKPAPLVHEPSSEPEPGVLKEFVSDLETSLGDGFLPDAAAGQPVSPAASAGAYAATTHAVPKAVPAAHTPPAAVEETPPVLGEFVADIEASLGEDFLKAAPIAQPEAPAPVEKDVPKPAPPIPAPVVTPPVVTRPVVTRPVVAPAVVAPPNLAPHVAPSLAASAAASASQVAPSAPQSAPAMTAPTAAATGSVAWQTGVVHAPKPTVSPAPAAYTAPATSTKGSPFGDDAGVDLAEMFGELLSLIHIYSERFGFAPADHSSNADAR